MSSPILLSVIIPTYKDNARLNLCLEALEHQKLTNDQFEVIIVNNDPVSEIEISISYSLNIKIVKEEKLGSYSARNTGIRLAKGKYLAFTDSDCLPDEDWLKNSLDFINQLSEEYFILSGQIKLFFKDIENLTLAESYEKFFAFQYQRDENNYGMVTANCVIPRKVFRKVGFFNAELLSGGDTEFGRRAQKSGIKIHYCPECIVYHPARYRLKSLLNKRRRVFGGKMKIDKEQRRDGKLKVLTILTLRMFKRQTKKTIELGRRYRNQNFRTVFKAQLTSLALTVAYLIEAVKLAMGFQPKRS